MVLRVVKIGGSLLGLPELVPRLRIWLAEQPLGNTILVVGGGAMADCVRTAQTIHRFSDQIAHWLCIRAMSMQAEMLLAMLPEALPLKGSDLALAGSSTMANQLWLLEPWQFMREYDRQHPSPLPESWDVTSDSIAARAAELLGADELVLLKSAAPPVAASLTELAEIGYVDRFFPVAALRVTTVRFVDLRSGPID